MEEKKENILETGNYTILGPDSGDVMIDTIELNAGNGAQRIWKVKTISKKEIVLEIVKFS